MPEKKEFNIDRVSELVRELIIEIGEDPDREGLEKTPERVAKAWQFMTKGYRQDRDAIINDALFQSDHQLIMGDRIEETLQIRVIDLCAFGFQIVLNAFERLMGRSFRSVSERTIKEIFLENRL